MARLSHLPRLSFHFWGHSTAISGGFCRLTAAGEQEERDLLRTELEEARREVTEAKRRANEVLRSPRVPVSGARMSGVVGCGSGETACPDATRVSRRARCCSYVSNAFLDAHAAAHTFPTQHLNTLSNATLALSTLSRHALARLCGGL
eukprot:3631286-Rhodomonas_salina.1